MMEPCADNMIAPGYDSITRSRIHRLARYNAERMRGIVHTEDWKKHMNKEQAWFNKAISPVVAGEPYPSEMNEDDNNQN